MNREQVLNAFIKQYHDLIVRGLDVRGFASIVDVTFISVVHPFIFDSRLLPKEFMGYFLRSSIDEKTLPVEFEISDAERFSINPPYIWAPESFEKFVDRCADDVRTQLGKPNMTREEMLDALIGGNFQEHKRSVQEAVAKGKLPPYKG